MMSGDSYSCTRADYSENLGPFDIDYVYLFRCKFKDFEFVSIILIILWVVILIDLLGKIASDYFTPTLATMSSRWKLSDNFSGVTLVALANGAPDVFCSVIGLTRTGNADLSIGALLGGALFVCTVVVGCIAILSPCELNGLYFTRDAFFLLITLTRLAVLGSYKTVTLFSSISLCGIYIIYLLAVLLTPLIESRLTGHGHGPKSIKTDRLTNIQTALWIHDDRKVTNNKREKLISNITEDAATGYKFLILDEYVVNLSKRENTAKGSESSRSTNIEVDGVKYDDQNDEMIINLSGGLLSQSFSGNLIEEYYPPAHMMSNDALNPAIRNQLNDLKYPQLVVKETDSLSPDKGHLRESLLTGTIDELDIEGNETESHNTNMLSAFRSKFTKLYVLSLRRRFMKRLLDDWDSASFVQKICMIVEYPFITAMELTITTVDCELWNKRNAVIQPLVAPFFLLLALHLSPYLFSVTYWLCYVVLGVPTSLFIHIFAHRSHSPEYPVFINFWLLFGFMMCVTWIYVLSGELVFCLTSVGSILSIPTFYLGLTILAWGNSIGDLFSNISIAKRGLGEMAIAGCYGGPVFNILIGMGVSLSYICYRDYPRFDRFVLDTSACVSISFLFVAVISTMILTVFLRFRLNAIVGYFLITLYVLYTITQTALALKW